MDLFVDPMFDPDDEIYDPDTKSIDDVDLLKPVPIGHPAIETFKELQPRILKSLDELSRFFLTLYLLNGVPTVVIGGEVPQTIKNDIQLNIPPCFQLLFDGPPELFDDNYTMQAPLGGLQSQLQPGCSV
jgi:hypothetical protein